MKEKQQSALKELTAQGVSPPLAIVRGGEREDDIAYERGATKRCEGVGVTVKGFHPARRRASKRPPCWQTM